MTIYALDSDIISAVLKQNSDIIARYYQETEKLNKFIIPPIVFYEVERGLLSKNLLTRKRLFIKFCEKVKIGEFTYEVWQKAAQIYSTLSRQGKPIGNKFDGDVFIAAYCIINDFTLVTNNKNHFSRIDGLKYVIWNE